MSEGQEEELKSAFRQYIKTELSSPEVAQAKERFIHEHFGKQPSIIFRPAVLVPVLGLLFAFLMVLQIHKPVSKRLPFTEPSLKETVKPSLVKEIPYEPARLEINVEQVSSEVGPTLVYQKDWRNQPLTIVWVFTGGTNQ